MRSISSKFYQKLTFSQRVLAQVLLNLKLMFASIIYLYASGAHNAYFYGIDKSSVFVSLFSEKGLWSKKIFSYDLRTLSQFQNFQAMFYLSVASKAAIEKRSWVHVFLPNSYSTGPAKKLKNLSDVQSIYWGAIKIVLCLITEKKWLHVEDTTLNFNFSCFKLV